MQTKNWLDTRRRAIIFFWFAALISPTAVTLQSAYDWDVDPRSILIVSILIIATLRTALPGRAFFLTTYPIIFTGIIYIFADLHRNVDALDLALHWKTYSNIEIKDAITPYLAPIAFLGSLLAIWCYFCIKASQPQKTNRTKLLACTLSALTIYAFTSTETLKRAWPLSVASAGSKIISEYLAPQNTISGSKQRRNPSAKTWGARQHPTLTRTKETIILIIGESVRNDYLPECGGPPKIHRIATDALIACDVTSGANATHTSVPLLISREMPGHSNRAILDATFLSAFKEVGFETYWLSTQGMAVAWPDADHQSYIITAGRDEPLINSLKNAIAANHFKKAIVLHVNNAHTPYCSRYEQRGAAYFVNCDGLIGKPDERNLARYKMAYANAVDESVKFLNDVISIAKKSDGEVFLAYTPDHGEALLDDARQMFGHAFKEPTRWETHVPAIFWANAEWKKSHTTQWETLAANISAPLMHIDIVPTLIGSADITFTDNRIEAQNLLRSKNMPHRPRTVERGDDKSIEWDSLAP